MKCKPKFLYIFGVFALHLLAEPANAQVVLPPPTKEKQAFAKHLTDLYVQGWNLLLEQKTAEALRFFREAHDLNEHDQGHIGGMGIALWDLGLKNEAIAEWKSRRETSGSVRLSVDRIRPEARLVSLRLLEAGFEEEAKQIYYSLLPTTDSYSGQPVRMTVVFDHDDSPHADIWPLTPQRLEAAILMREYFVNHSYIEAEEAGALLLNRIRELAPDWALPVFYLGFHHPKDRQTHFNAGIAMERNPLRKAEMKLAAKTDFWDGEDDNPEGWVPTSKIILELESVKRAREAIRNSTFWRH